jgi:hypothetical protein
MIRITRIALLITFFANLVLPSTIVLAENSTSIEVPLEVLNSNQIVRLEGLMSTQNLEFTIPYNWKITDQSWLDISVTASDLLSFDDSSITVSLNGLQVTSLQLTDLAGSRQRIKLPANFFVTGNNVLTLDGILYLPDDLKTNCKGWEDPSRWMYFTPQSRLHIGFQKQSLPADLSNFPDVFLQPLDRYIVDSGHGTIFVLPDEVKPDDLNALIATTYFLGHHAGENFPWSPQIISNSEFTQLKNINENVIFINHIPAQFENAIATEKNAIGIFSSPWDSNKTIMIIFDKDREDGYTPALIFGDWIKRVLLSGNVAYFDQTAEKNHPSFQNKYSFEELGYLDRTVRGIGMGNLIYKIYIPYNVDPTSANLALQIANSPDLDDKTSTISVNLNGFTVASILPDAKNSRLEPIRVDLPTKRLRPGINYLRLSFDLHIPYSSCEKAPESVWATTFNSSTFQLTYRDRRAIPLLDDFPVPFNEYAGVTFVIPNHADTQILLHLSQLTFTLGASSFDIGQPPAVLTAQEYSSAKTNQGHHILIGLPSENNAIKEINDYLPQPFKSGTNQLQDGYGVFLPDIDSVASTGLVQIMPSPKDDDSIILVVTGTDLQGLNQAWKAVLDSKTREQFSGNIMVAGPEAKIATDGDDLVLTNVHFEQTPMVVNIPIIGKFLQGNGQSENLISLAAVALAGLVTLAALKITPVLSRLEVRFKKHPDHSQKEQE